MPRIFKDPGGNGEAIDNQHRPSRKMYASAQKYVTSNVDRIVSIKDETASLANENFPYTHVRLEILYCNNYPKIQPQAFQFPTN